MKIELASCAGRGGKETLPVICLKTRAFFDPPDRVILALRLPFLHLLTGYSREKNIAFLPSYAQTRISTLLSASSNSSKH